MVFANGHPTKSEGKRHMYKNCRSDDAVAKIAFEGNVKKVLLHQASRKSERGKESSDSDIFGIR